MMKKINKILRIKKRERLIKKLYETGMYETIEYNADEDKIYARKINGMEWYL